MTSAKPNYFPALDGLRLLASINIVMLHLGSSSALAYMADFKWVMPIINAPAFAAGIFYVLAGFLFASKFSDPERRIPVVPFMFARIAKLYRLHFFMTLLMFVVLVFKFSGYSHLPALNEIGDCAAAGLAKMTHPWRSLFLHLSLTWSIVPDLGMKLNEPSWSLTSFFVCYAVTPWFSRWLFRQSNRTLWVLFATLFIPGILWAVFFGLSDNLWFDSYDAKYRFFHIFAPVRIFEYLGSLFLMRPELNPGFNYFFHHSLPIMLYGLFLVSLLTGEGFMARFFCIGIVRKIGRASFYPYLIHLPLITIAWGICNLNRPKNTILLLLFIYSVSTLYSEFKVWRRKKQKAKQQAASSAAPPTK